MRKVAIVLFSLLAFSGCDSVTVKKHLKSYKLYLVPFKEFKSYGCTNAEGILMVKDELVAGQALFEQSGVGLTIRGGYKNETQEIAVDFINSEGEYAGIAGGKLEANGGKGSWTFGICEGNWVAVREQ